MAELTQGAVARLARFEEPATFPDRPVVQVLAGP